MDQIEIGKFIAKCRREVGLTQAQLAEKLNITDRAVSKWETGRSMPDSSIMLELCEILGITVTDLLSGEKIEAENYEKKATENLIALKREDEKNTAKRRVFPILFSAVLLIAVLVCLICDLALSGSLTWSLIPVGSIVFAWLVSFPGIVFGKRGYTVSLLALSVLAVPYLYLLSRLIHVDKVFSLGTAMAAPSILFLWIVAAVFRRIGKGNVFVALGTTFLFAVPFVFLINAVLSKMIGAPIWDIWDMLSVCVLLILALASFAYAKKKKSKK